ncbi:hypothetical protein C427_0745 [Paraglaciecola psychrophila 170]|uniref:Uncharacterized protein n=1 Tax=Paraglaciecola psychrophila 170 TaxID=1129794 RepID=K7A7G1_9ALTE|nr:hypothetical protein C427_0745 [Paraglaciecola psychrophila 170]GAC36738.1 hypothetical protein GPSY_1100 [Paraglaciecola psychrophila 170]
MKGLQGSQRVVMNLLVKEVVKILNAIFLSLGRGKPFSNEVK